MLNLNLKPIFQARGIHKPYSFLVKAGFSPHTAANLVSNSTRAFKLDHIELLCKALVCEPNDLLSYTTDSHEGLSENHPLLKLQYTDHQQNLKQTLATIPFKQLKEITKNLTQNSQ